MYFTAIGLNITKYQLPQTNANTEIETKNLTQDNILNIIDSMKKVLNEIDANSGEKMQPLLDKIFDSYNKYSTQKQHQPFSHKDDIKNLSFFEDNIYKNIIRTTTYDNIINELNDNNNNNFAKNKIKQIQEEKLISDVEPSPLKSFVIVPRTDKSLVINGIKFVKPSSPLLIPNNLSDNGIVMDKLINNIQNNNNHINKNQKNLNQINEKQSLKINNNNNDIMDLLKNLQILNKQEEEKQKLQNQQNQESNNISIDNNLIQLYNILQKTQKEKNNENNKNSNNYNDQLSQIIILPEDENNLTIIHNDDKIINNINNEDYKIHESLKKILHSPKNIVKIIESLPKNHDNIFVESKPVEKNISHKEDYLNYNQIIHNRLVTKMNNNYDDNEPTLMMYKQSSKIITVNDLYNNNFEKSTLEYYEKPVTLEPLIIKDLDNINNKIEKKLFTIKDDKNIHYFKNNQYSNVNNNNKNLQPECIKGNDKLTCKVGRFTYIINKINDLDKDTLNKFVKFIYNKCVESDTELHDLTTLKKIYGESTANISPMSSAINEYLKPVTLVCTPVNSQDDSSLVNSFIDKKILPQEVIYKCNWEKHE